MTAVFWYDPVYTDGISPEARFPRERYRMVRAELEARDVRAEIRPSPVVDRRDLELVHTRGYVEAFYENRLDEAMARRIGLRPWTERIRERTDRILGGTVAAVHALFETPSRITGNLAGGTHHAFADAGAGYCVFNDIAVAVEVARRDHGVKRALVVDLDVHQGDGTASIFGAVPEVYTLSVHGEKNFPFRKQTSDLDVALPDGVDDEAYLESVSEVLPIAFERAQPELVVFQAGVDPLAQDHLGRMSLSRDGLARRNELVFEACADRPLLLTMGGGYARPIERSVEALGDLFERAAERAALRAPSSL